jgi:hypothetical protein
MKRTWDKFDQESEREGRCNGISNPNRNRIRTSENYNKEKFDKLFK